MGGCDPAAPLPCFVSIGAGFFDAECFCGELPSMLGGATFRLCEEK